MSEHAAASVGRRAATWLVCLFLVSACAEPRGDETQSHVTDSAAQPDAVSSTIAVSSTAAITTVAVDSDPRVLVRVAYRSDPVDIADPAFEYLDTSGSSLVRGAWYDADTGYMVINLNGTYYHYCGMPISAWIAFQGASSFGSHYNSSIQGRYDCRVGVVPDY